MITLASLRAHLVSAFEPDVRIIGNTTRQEIVEAIDVAMGEVERLSMQHQIACNVGVAAAASIDRIGSLLAARDAALATARDGLRNGERVCAGLVAERDAAEALASTHYREIQRLDAELREARRERDEARERVAEGRRHVESFMLEKRVAIAAALKSGAEPDAMRPLLADAVLIASAIDDTGDEDLIGSIKVTTSRGRAYLAPTVKAWLDAYRAALGKERDRG